MLPDLLGPAARDTIMSVLPYALPHTKRPRGAEGCMGLTGCIRNVLSAGVETARFRHLVPDLAVSAQLPGQGGDANDDAHEGGRVCLPV